MYFVRPIRCASLMALSDRSGCGHSGSFWSDVYKRSLKIQASLARYQA